MASSVTVTTVATLLVAAKAPSQRGNVLLQVLAGGGDVWVSRSADITAGVGFLLRPNADAPCTMLIENDLLSKPAASAWYGIVASGSQAVIVEEGA